MSQSISFCAGANYESGGWGFKSPRARQLISQPPLTTSMNANRCRAMKLPRLSLGLFLCVWLSGCASVEAEQPVSSPFSRAAKSPPGFFERLADSFSERECNVGRFTCPYGLGPAGEPCECDDPRGIVRKGQTVK